MSERTITFTPEIMEEIEQYLRFECNHEDLSPAAKDALEVYAEQQRRELVILNPGRPRRTLNITPAPEGSGLSDVSVNHDKYLAEDLMSERTRE